jgi:hypothetical protein
MHRILTGRNRIDKHEITRSELVDPQMRLIGVRREVLMINPL